MYLLRQNKVRNESLNKMCTPLPARLSCCIALFLSLFLVVVSCKGKRNIMQEKVSCNENAEAVEKWLPVQTLAGSDELGRVLPGNKEVGDVRDDRQVGMFYFLWQGDNASKTSQHHWDLSKIVPEHPEVLKDRSNPHWGSTNVGAYYFWGEPIYGYYRGDDLWVHTRNMQLLTDAGVDFLLLDATNAIIYEKQSKELMKAIKSLQDQGRNPPKIAYYTNSDSGKTMQRIYNAFYKTGAPCYFPSTWYYMEGKPLILGRTNEAAEKDYVSFFTFRQAQWPNEPEQQNGWPWIDFKRPQSVYVNHKGEREIINVSVAQHPDPKAGMGGSAFYGNKNNWGRSYRNGTHGDPDTDILHGYNFQEQWDYALGQDLPFVFITGWNEWIAGRWRSFDGNPNHSYFVDQADPEYSRDIEPTYTAGLRDNYYMQLVANIRRYKGVNAPPPASAPKKILSLADWDQVTPVYIDYVDDTRHRRYPGAESNPERIYENSTGRNDFHVLKVARDNKNLYFYAETTDDITENSGNDWMTLYLNTDRKFDTGWHGYDYRVVEGRLLQQYTDDRWKTIHLISPIVEGKKLMHGFPASVVGLNTKDINMEFKWSDNMHNDNDPMDWYLNGDTAPGGRFNFIYATK